MADEQTEPRNDAQPSEPAPTPKEPLPSRPDPQLVREREANDNSTPQIIASEGK